MCLAIIRSFKKPLGKILAPRSIKHQSWVSTAAAILHNKIWILKSLPLNHLGPFFPLLSRRYNNREEWEIVENDNRPDLVHSSPPAAVSYGRNLFLSPAIFRAALFAITLLTTIHAVVAAADDAPFQSRPRFQPSPPPPPRDEQCLSTDLP